MRHRATLVVVASIAFAAHLTAQHARPLSEAASTSRHLAAIRNNPSLLLAFLNEMPKGGDLHNHLSGAIYAESYLRWAAADNLCVATATMTIVGGACDAASGRPEAAQVLQDGALYSQAIDAMSMRNWNRALNGHDHFFDTFAKFGPASLKTGDMVAEVSARAAAEHVSYLELMVTLDGGLSAIKGAAAGWDPDFDRTREKLLAAGFADIIAAAKRRLDDADARRTAVLRCGTPQPDAGCSVAVRFIYQVGRSAPPQTVFAQMLAGFEVVTHDPRVVALNLVAPEDGMVAVRDFSLHMRMLDSLHRHYPQVPITLHAGELTVGLVPPEALRFHVGESVRIGHARRVGHATAVMYEDGALDLLREMAAKRVLVETALSSSDLILGVTGARHPLRTYLQYGVPVALVTDDAGVSRTSLTQEYRRAVEEQGLDYPTLKKLARNSIAFSFADAASKTRLESDLDAAFRAFESRRRPPS
jgi:hypothetical protein